MRLTEKERDRAIIIRNAASLKWAVPTTQIDWWSCAWMAKRGEELPWLTAKTEVVYVLTAAAAKKETVQVIENLGEWKVVKPEPIGELTLQARQEGEHGLRINIYIKMQDGREICAFLDGYHKNALNVRQKGLYYNGKEITHISIPASIAGEIKELQDDIKRQEKKKMLYIEKGAHEQYRISQRLERDDWRKVAAHMERKTVYNPFHESEDEEFSEVWLIRVGHEEAVEDALEILPKNRRAVKEPRDAQSIEDEKKYRQDKKSAGTEIKAAFDPQDAETPERENNKLLPMPEGEKVVIREEDNYGGGLWYIIQEDAIWQIQNNGADGDFWGANNIRTGGAGAIGREYERTERRINALRKYAEVTA